MHFENSGIFRKIWALSGIQGAQEKLSLCMRVQTFIPVFSSMSLGIFRNVSGNRQNARRFRIGIVGYSKGILGQALP